ncbi:MAG TPA: hypothetical protein VFR37_21575 [Longimicrobium sp.]|nr:hypothetical protein [Longimicrobium sp.]
MRAKRIALVTAGLMAAGAVFGGIAGVVAGAGWFLLMGGPGLLFDDPGYLLFVGLTGGALGSVLGPAAAWGMMRHVPLWLAVGGTTLGTLAGGLLGAVSFGRIFLGGPGFILLGGLAGFVMSAAALCVSVPSGGRRIGGGARTRLPGGGG